MKNVYSVHLTSEGVGWYSLICDDAVTIQTARAVDIVGQILKWKYPQLGIIHLRISTRSPFRIRTVVPLQSNHKKHDKQFALKFLFPFYLNISRCEGGICMISYPGLSDSRKLKISHICRKCYLNRVQCWLHVTRLRAFCNLGLCLVLFLHVSRLRVHAFDVFYLLVCCLLPVVINDEWRIHPLLSRASSCSTGPKLGCFSCALFSTVPCTLFHKSWPKLKSSIASSRAEAPFGPGTPSAINWNAKLL